MDVHHTRLGALHLDRTKTLSHLCYSTTTTNHHHHHGIHHAEDSQNWEHFHWWCQHLKTGLALHFLQSGRVVEVETQHMEECWCGFDDQTTKEKKQRQWLDSMVDLLWHHGWWRAKTCQDGQQLVKSHDVVEESACPK